MIDENGKTVFRAFSFTNTTDGGESLLDKLSQCGANEKNLVVGLEATGHYWLAARLTHEKNLIKKIQQSR